MHHFIHFTRDVCVRMLSDQPLNDALPAIAGGRDVPPAHPVMEHFRPAIGTILNTIVDVFNRLLVESGAKVWVSLRDRRADGKFHTFDRAGFYNPNRAGTSQPLEENWATIQLLKERFSSGDCVIMTGIGKKGWHQLQNDGIYEENKSVLMGAVIAKEVKGDLITNGPLCWVLCVNSATPDIFTASHKRILQGCNDSLSAILNVMLRSTQLKKRK